MAGLHKYTVSGIILLSPTDFTRNPPWTPKGRTEWARKLNKETSFLESYFLCKGLATIAYDVCSGNQRFACHFHIKRAVLQLNSNCRLPAPKSVLVSEVSAACRRPVVDVWQEASFIWLEFNLSKLDVSCVLPFTLKTL